MGFNLLFWKNNQTQSSQILESKNEPQYCICGNNKDYADCHELEFALPLGEKPEPDY